MKCPSNLFDDLKCYMNAILNTSYFIKHLPSEFQTHNGSNLLLYLVPLNFFTECANTNEEM